MGQKTDQIERHIEEQRYELGENLNELQQRVKDTFDWRAQFEQRPLVMLGLALGSGVLLSAIIGRRSRSNHVPTERWHSENSEPAATNTAADYSAPTNPATTYPVATNPAATNTNRAGNGNAASKASESWRDIKSALAGVAAMQLGAALDSWIPGFSSEYDKVKRGDGTFQRQHPV